ncbi:ribosome biogenesis GTPase Der [Actinospongicola halichondriae]|uniref:ribosome biogenesis GTPase Der n=1 Tax=Actinospongicola halichondriae TaxID=3236844 RepID=UPI003D5207D2
MTARVAIVGRPNVGKSTLVNRLAGRRTAIVEEQAGVTRDRKVVPVEWTGRSFEVVDTGGWMPGGSALDEKVSRQSEKAMEESDIVIFVVDGTTGVTEEDAMAAAVLRRKNKPVLLVVNKIDDPRREVMIWDFMELGLGQPRALSALHGPGSADLLDELLALIPEEIEPELSDDNWSEGDEIAVAIVGRPNVGKSTLFNRLAGEEQSIVHDMPGTTRDTIDTVVSTDEGMIRFVDTAGMRRRSKVDDGTEYYSVVRALQAVDKANIAILVIDASEGITSQDLRLAERVDLSGCPVIVLLNKWEITSAEQREDILYQVGQRLHFIGESPVLQVSALTGKGVQRLYPALGSAIAAYETRVPTKKVNDVIRAAQQAQPAPHGARVLYALQGAANPPTFTLFANRELPKTYVRYLERSLREAFDLQATPLKLRVRKRD